ncbi:hypothetical protein QL996_08095 [Planococcus sp. APC 4015]|nr:hypothetical protein [Planococcus sp. APC 4015]
MTWEGAVAVMIGAAVVILALAALGWWRRTRRDAALDAPVGEAPEGAVVLADFRTLYVATTVHDQPLERLAMRGLSFRSRADVTVTDAGIALDLTGKPRIFLGTARIDAVDQATVAIDRVVEKDGLVRLAWRLDDGTVVDSYLRPQDTSARSLADSIAGILTPHQTGTDA